MDITYLGHSCFKLRSTNATVVTDPYPNDIGLKMPSVSADIITVSHTQHNDHNAIDKVSGTARREKPFVITAPGEFEIGGVSIFGLPSYHDDKKGQERGENTLYVIHIDEVKVAHLGDLGHMLSDKQLTELDGIDVLLVPIGGVYTIDSKTAQEVINAVQPAYAIPMHFKTPDHNNSFSDMTDLKTGFEQMGQELPEIQEKLTVTVTSLPEETEMVVLSS